MIEKHFIIFLTVYFIFLLHSTIGQCQNKSECVLLKSCETYANVTKSEVIKELRLNFCGFESNEPKICCLGKQIKNKNQTEELLPGDRVCGFHFIDFGSSNYTDLVEQPWSILIRTNNLYKNNSFYCGGVLISSQYVLTAAHCIKNKPNPENKIEVRLGEWDLTKQKDCIDEDCNNPVQDMLVEETISHENHTAYQDDLALLRLNEKVKYSESVKPICILPVKIDYTDSADLVGWAKSADTNGTNLKLKGLVNIVSEQHCKNLSDEVGSTMSDRQVCVKGDFCAGDSGGAITFQAPGRDNILVYGIEAYRSSNCTHGVAVYTVVHSYRDWILRHMRP